MAPDIDLTQGEEIIDQVVVRVWKRTQAWILLFLLPFIGLLPFSEILPFVAPVLTLMVLWYSTYFIRQRWRLTLTNRQIVARQLLPRPLTALSPIYYFPINKIEGLTVGPRAFRNILLVGVFISTNLGVTLLKSGLSPEGYDLPDSVEAVVLVLHGITFLPFMAALADGIESLFESILSQVDDVLIVMGTTLIILGVITVILTIPRRFHLQIRMRHSHDFRLAAGIPRSFWESCYQQLYKETIVEAPSEYRKWRFPWLDGEKMETSADLEQIIYTNRFISLFAIYAGSLRIWNRAASGRLGEDVLLWLIVAVMDIVIAVLAVYFSKRKNEMVVTNRRIIFAEEMKDLSGTFGRRLYQMSDIRRDDVAGFHLSRIKGLSFRYLLLTVIFGTITVVYWNAVPHTISGYFVRVVFVLLILLFATFINQTYVQFDLKTKGHEIWHMRHQLSNPLTFMRELIGNEDNAVLTTLMSNRLEEKEVVDTMQIIRSGDTGLKPKLFADTKFFGDTDQVTEPKQTRSLDLSDLLLDDEEILYEANVSRGVPRRKLNLTIGSLFIASLMSLQFIPVAILGQGQLPEAGQAGIFVSFLVIPMLIIALWVKYYSLFRATIVLTKWRAFFLDIKRPPWLLYLFGVTHESQIDETLHDQIHSTYTSRQLSQQQYFRELMSHWGSIIGSSIIFGLCLAYIGSYTDILDSLGPAAALVLQVIVVIYHVTTLHFTWHFGNAYIAFIRSLPKRVVNTKGVGSHFIVPFASKEKADAVTHTVWQGIIAE